MPEKRPLQPADEANKKPKITSEISMHSYSSVQVFQQLLKESPVLRRVRDGKFNARTILSLANLPKKKRTAVLKKCEGLEGAEKITVGYYLYQGVWINTEDAERLAKVWGVRAQLDEMFNMTLDVFNARGGQVYAEEEQLQLQGQKQTKVITNDKTPETSEIIKEATVAAILEVQATRSSFKSNSSLDSD